MHNGTDSPITFNTFSNLYPAILQCFVVILLGYVAGRTRIVALSQAQGLGNYVTYFALPALIFKATAELEFSKVNWLFWAAILVSKAIVFIVVYVSAFVLSKNWNIGKAGIFAMFTTQSNDFALGYPIVLALYKDHHPEFVQYIYLLAPISLILLNPAGFLSLEIQKGGDVPEAQRSRLRMIWRVLRGLLTNPVMIMVLAGIVANLAGHQKLPLTISGILDVLGSSFSATALFYLGTSMVGKFEAKSGYYFVVPALLCGAKLILNPLLIRQLVFTMNPGGEDANLTEAYSTLGFLYGTIPTAPSVFLFANYYQESATIIATSLVLCTFASAPLMFITATMVMMPISTSQEYQQVLNQSTFDVSCVGMLSCLWVFLIFVLGVRYRRFPHEFTLQLVVAQFLPPLAIFLCNVIDTSPYWLEVIQFVVFLSGVMASRGWVAMVALSLCLVRCHSTCFVMRYRIWFYIYGWGIPLFLVGLLTAASPSNLHPMNVIYMYGSIQLIASAVNLLINCVITIASLMVLYKYDKYQQDGYQGIPGCDMEETEKLLRSTLINGENEGEDQDTAQSPTDRNVTDIEDLNMGSPPIEAQMCTNSCDREHRSSCRRRLWVRRMEHLMTSEEDYNVAETHQIGRHMALLLLMLISMIISLFVSLWKLFNESKSGISLELEFLDIVFSYGQGFFVLATFGFDKKNVIIPVIKFFHRLVYGVEKVQLPLESEIDPEVKQICEHFKMNYRLQCHQSVSRNIRHKLKVLSNTFYGRDLITWLVKHELANDRSDAVSYGRNLLICRIIEHVKQEHHFHDRSYVYRFIDETVKQL